jgi:hypothetical protein
MLATLIQPEIQPETRDDGFRFIQPETKDDGLAIIKSKSARLLDKTRK